MFALAAVVALLVLVGSLALAASLQIARVVVAEEGDEDDEDDEDATGGAPIAGPDFEQLGR